MINPAQLRAARALLDLSQKNVAEEADIGLNTISYIESGRTEAETKTLEKLQRFYEGRDISFKDGGAFPKLTGIVTYQGQTGFRAFMDDVYTVSAGDVKQDICIFNGLPADFIEWLGADWYAEHSARMAKIKNRYRFRVIVKDQESALIGSAFAEYRWIDTDLFGQSVIYVYGDRVAILTFGDSVDIIRIDRREFADSQRILFELVWMAAHD